MHLPAPALLHLLAAQSTLASDGLESIGASVSKIWHYELFRVSNEPLTLGRIFLALCVLVLSVTLSKILSRLFARTILPRFKVEPGVQAALQSLSYYVLVVVFVLTALRVVQVPLALFTVLGGALAIGVGFGSQNLVNNFMSGIILLMEHPIRPGDVVEIEGVQGTVEEIGARSTHVRTLGEARLVVPNSFFLERKVLNWTRTGTAVRDFVKVGVAYGSPAEKVKEILFEAARSHGKILPSPAPIVLFSNFGDSALEFEVYFWHRVPDPFDKKEIESDLRYDIERRLQSAGIVIAFPQRDLHVRSVPPLEVRVAPTPPRGGNP
ncbi:MAG: mechanosensitive ion channel domain-containing protein [Bdellovibrionota bacterium]